jgi:hypothetical protein
MVYEGDFGDEGYEVGVQWMCIVRIGEEEKGTPIRAGALCFQLETLGF